MRKRCIEGYAAAAAFLVVARATATITVDDGDPGIQYHGTWVHNLINDPKDLNYGGSVTFTNVSGSTATYKFTGTAIAVFGAFEVAGTFSMHSTYSIDGGPATDFIPASTTVRAAYRQKFFQSDTLSDGEHTLVIANVGRELWLDYLLITPPPQATTTAAESTLSQKVQTPSASTIAQAPPPITTGPATTSSSSAGQSVTAQSGSGPSSQTQTTHSLSNTNNATLTSTDAAVPPPLATGSTSQSGTSVLASGIVSPTSTPAPAHSSKLAAGAIAGLAVAGLVIVVIVLVGLVGWRSRRWKQAHRRDDLTPYNPGLTALASEPSEKQDLAHDGNSRGSTTTSLLSLSPPVPAYTQAPAETCASGSSGPGERSMPHEIQTTDLPDGMRMGRDRRTGFEPLGSPSSASPLLARHPHGGRQQQQQKESPITSSAGLSRYMSPLDERRRSIDGGVRIAGGPPGNLGQEDALGDGDDDVRSGLSTLPPSYQLYTAV